MPDILIAPDSFKSVMDAGAVAQAIAQGIHQACPGAQTVEAPMADGGEGTLEIILTAANGLRRRVQSTGPLGDPVEVTVGLIRNASVAVVEMATVAGYALVPEARRHPLRASTYGLGVVLRTVIETGLEEIILTVGGSATVDGGAGMMQALGLTCLDVHGRIMDAPIGGGDLKRIGRIVWDRPPENFENVQFTIACDVLNAACGVNGAARVFGPQKGADAAGVRQLEDGLAHWAGLLEYASGRPLRHEPGTGAGGGVALPLLGFASSQLVPGVDLVSEMIELPGRMQDADLVITGEGRLDAQSMMGKVVGAVGRMARSMDVPCVAIAGVAGDGAAETLGVLDRYYTLDAPLEETESMLTATASRIAREWFS